MFNTYNINIFGPPKPKNRRLTPWEREQEKIDAAIWHRPQRHFLFDMPYYPWVPKNPEAFISEYYKVNFDLDYTK